MSVFFYGIGDSIIQDKSILIKNYPFKPSIAYPKRTFTASEINSIYLDASPHYFKVKNDLIFITVENKNKLEEFAKRNKIPPSETPQNWELLLEPFLDTQFDDKDKKRTNELLKKNNIYKDEVTALRNEVASQMYKYNAKLWDWCSLGLSDVLSAMRVKYSSNKFEEFYTKAIEIELRKTQHNKQ